MAKQKFSFKTVLVEVLIVIIGITIAFWLNSWGEERKERQLEAEFLKTLRSELSTDSVAFAYQGEEIKKDVKHIYDFISTLKQKDYDHDSIAWYIGSFMNRSNWIVNANTYDILKSGGKLDIISDFELRTQISAFFRIRTFQAERILDVIQDFIDHQMHVYLAKNTSYFINPPDKDFVKDREFQNLLVLWAEFNDQKLMLYQEILSDIGRLISKLDDQLK